MVQVHQPGARVGEDGGERLVDLVGDRGHQLAQQGETRGVDEIETRGAQLVLGVLALGDVAARVEHRAGLDRDLLEVYEQGAVLTRLGHDVALDVADLPAGRQLGAVEEIVAQEPADPAHGLHLVRGVPEDHVHVRTDERERALVVGEEDRVRDVAEGQTMELFRVAERLEGSRPGSIRQLTHRARSDRVAGLWSPCSARGRGCGGPMGCATMRHQADRSQGSGVV
jgi:hypothetical protein